MIGATLNTRNTKRGTGMAYWSSREDSVNCWTWKLVTGGHIPWLHLLYSLTLFCRIAGGKPSGVESAQQIAVGSVLSLGGKELEVDCEIPKSDFASGKCFGASMDTGSPNPVIRNSISTVKPFKPLRPKTLNSDFRVPSASGGLKPRATSSRTAETSERGKQHDIQNTAPQVHMHWTATGTASYSSFAPST